MLTKLVNELNGATSVEEAEQYYPAIADVLLNQSLVEINGKDYRLMEIEFYFLPAIYKDPFVHGNKRQAENLQWYFHRKGEGGYSNGNYKGLDLTIGNGINRGGILIRAVRNVQSNEYQEGSSLFVDLLMNNFGASDIKALAPKLEELSPFDSNSSLKIKPSDQLPKIPFTTAPRFGLTLINNDVELRKKFIYKSYRYLSEPSLSKKGKHFIFLSMIQRGSIPSEAADFLKIRQADALKYIASYETGIITSPDKYVGLDDMTLCQQCELMGALSKSQKLRRP
ncbi:MAG: hypothetical protein V4598_16545 [Bdellovibrionota bacterium]